MYAEFCNMAQMLQVNTGRKRRGQTSEEYSTMAVPWSFCFSPLGMSKARPGVACLEGEKGKVWEGAHGQNSWNGCQVGLEHTRSSWIGQGISSLATELLVWLEEPFYYRFLYLCFCSWVSDFGGKKTTLECFLLDPGRCPPCYYESKGLCCRQPLDLSLICPTLVLLRTWLEQKIAKDNS